ncbi:MAG: hypothetical protein CM15mV2_2490 [uncultured marine virus]|nr:MAG: hypothetical protein CM15mV2_2490 [uncultured marine virus]
MSRDLTPDDVDILAYSPTATHLCNTFTASGEKSTFLKSKFPNAEIWYIGHHMCHAASAVFTSPFNSGSWFTLDGMGSPRWDFADSSTKGFENNSIDILIRKRIFRPFNLFSGQGENSFGDYYMEMAVQTYNLKKSKSHSYSEQEVWKNGVKGLNNELIFHYDEKNYIDVSTFPSRRKSNGTICLW